MENAYNECKKFEFALKDLMRGCVGDSDDLSYIVCYLSYLNAKLNNKPYINFYDYPIKSNFESFIDAVNHSFSNLNTDDFDAYICESIKYLNEFRYSKIDGKELVNLLSTKDIYFYERILTSNVFGETDIYYYGKQLSTNNDLINLFEYFSKGESVFDVGSGNGNVLIGMSQNHNIHKADGIEINPRNAFVSKLRLSCCNNLNSKIINDDYLSAHIQGKYSLVTINMPFGLHIGNMKRRELKSVNDNEYYFDWPLSPSISSEWIYVNKALRILEPGGRIVLVTLQTPLFKTADIKQRKDLINNNLIEYVINMPAGTITSTGVKYSIVVLNNKKDNNNVKFLDASNCYIFKKPNKAIDSQEIMKRLYSDEVLTISNDDIAENDYNLNIDYYNGNQKKTKLRNPVSLEQLNVEISRGFQMYSKENTCENGEYSIITISDIDDNGNISGRLNRFNTDKDVNRYRLHENDLLISTKGTKIKTCIVKDLKDLNTIYHGNLTLIRNHDSKLNPIYLKIYLESDRGQQELKSIQTGTSIISINSSQLSKIIIPLIPIEEQNKIVNEYLFKTSEIDALSKRLNELQNNLTDSVNDAFRGE